MPQIMPSANMDGSNFVMPSTHVSSASGQREAILVGVHPPPRDMNSFVETSSNSSEQVRKCVQLSSMKDSQCANLFNMITDSTKSMKVSSSYPTANAFTCYRANIETPIIRNPFNFGTSGAIKNEGSEITKPTNESTFSHFSRIKWKPSANNLQKSQIEYNTSARGSLPIKQPTRSYSLKCSYSQALSQPNVSVERHGVMKRIDSPIEITHNGCGESMCHRRSPFTLEDGDSTEEGKQISTKFQGKELVKWMCRQLVFSGQRWSCELVRTVTNVCGCLLKLNLLRTISIDDDSSEKSSAKSLQSDCTSTSVKHHAPINELIYPHRNSKHGNLGFQMNTVYEWNLMNELISPTETQNAVDDRAKQFYLQNLSELKAEVEQLRLQYEEEFDRMSRVYELEIFQAKNQNAMKTCHLMGRINTLERDIEKYRVLAGIESLARSPRFDGSRKYSTMEATRESSLNRAGRPNYKTSEDGIPNRTEHYTNEFG